MKIWYQSFGRLDHASDYGKLLKQIIQNAADPGTTVDVRGLEKGKALADNYRYLEHLEVGEIIENGTEAARNGYDAFLIGNIADPGLQDLREAVRIPVLGLCETALHLASIMGAGFSLITINDKFTPRVVENVDRYKLRPHLVSVDRMRIDWLPDLYAVFQEPRARQNLIDQFMDASEAAISKGAEVLIPAGGLIMAFLAAQNIHAVGRAPILNGIITLVKMGETAVKLQRLTGHFVSKQMRYAAPNGDALRKIREAYGDHVYPGAV
jgi:allantoin racemase